MNELTISRKFFRFTTNTQRDFAQHFRIYDCGARGYVVMTDGKVIGTADNIVQAQQLAMDSTPKVWGFNCYGVCVKRLPLGRLTEYNKAHPNASERITDWVG